MFSLILIFPALIAQSNTLLIPISPTIQQAQSNDSSTPPQSLQTLSISNTPPGPIPPIPIANTTTTPTSTPPPHLAAWPPLPFTTDTGHHLNITISLLGPPLPPTRADEILNDITELHRVIATEGSPYEKIAGVYARSSGNVWTIFGCKPGAEMRRYQAVQVVSKIWFFMLDYGPREVQGSEITVEGRGVASFVLRFFNVGSGVEG